jgi:nucleotide-binding universal stress UspA family protein
MYRYILIPTDGSRLSHNAIAHGVALAKSINAKVTILTVSTPSRSHPLRIPRP